MYDFLKNYRIFINQSLLSDIAGLFAVVGIIGFSLIFQG